ncbi:MAG: choice-of-anchor B family protein [Saprospiraceae bacterium]|nr:choice-of-anchor B family protein [Saprospiraceae bacterium]
MSLIKFFLFFLISSFSLLAQDGDFNMEILANVKVPEGGSGIWHYVDNNGIEYAVFGSRTAVIIYSLEDPKNPIERFRLPGVETTWREVFIYGDYIYGVNDNQANGLIIINMKQAPLNITGKFWKSTITANGITEELNTCHTVFVDEKGRLYLNGCGSWRGTLIFDITKTPEEPQFLGAQTARYCHDNFGRNDTIWSSDILDGVLSFWDIKNPASPKEIGVVRTPFSFTHNAWPSDDGKYVFATDERADAYVASYDVTDLSDIKLLDTWRPKDTEGKGVIPHNTRYINGFLVTAFYTDGIKINDVHRPDNIVEVGSVDTWFGAHGGFNGCWGVSPFLPSGTIVASDIQAGLFVIKPTYVRACYLEGRVTDSITGFAIKDVSVNIVAPRKNGKTTDQRGDYKTGYAFAGTYLVTFNHPDYFPKTISVDLQNAEVNVQNVILKPRNLRIDQKIIVKDELTGQIIESAQIFLSNTNREANGQTDAFGEATISFFQDNLLFDLFVGKWGYFHTRLNYDSENLSGPITVFLKSGYQDDFIFEQNWNLKGSASAGLWVREEPIETLFRNMVINPGNDIVDDFGTKCYVTGNAGGGSGDDDVDNGNVVLTSPVINLSKYRRPIMKYSTWFANDGGSGNPNDKMTVRMTNGNETVVLSEILRTQNRWVETDNIDIASLLSLTDSMYLIIETADEIPGHLVEAGFDGFLITESQPNIVQETDPNILIEANPTVFNTSVMLNYHLPAQYQNAHLRINSMDGKFIQSIDLNPGNGKVEIGEKLAMGVYLLQIKVNNVFSKTIRVIKQ